MNECPLGGVFASGRSLKLHEDVFFRRDETPVPVACSNAAITRSGVVVGGVVIVRDISERLEAERRQQLLLDELDHRVRNTLAVVQSIAQQTFSGDAVREMREAFEGRLAALSGAHRLLTQSAWAATSLEDLIRRAVRPFANDARAVVAGPEIVLPAKASLSLALAIHELATNAAKYGALSVADGTISVTWDVVEEASGQRLTLTWQEEHGPAVAMPDRRGFGSRMLERGLAAELGGEVAISFAPAGVRCRISAPLPAANAV